MDFYPFVLFSIDTKDRYFWIFCLRCSSIINLRFLPSLHGDLFSLLQVIIACQDWPGTFFSPTLAQIAPWLSVLWGFKSDTSKRLKVEFGQGSLLSTTWWSFSKWQAMLLLTGLCCMFYYYLQDYQLKSSSFSFDRDTQAYILHMQASLLLCAIASINLTAESTSASL